MFNYKLLKLKSLQHKSRCVTSPAAGVATFIKIENQSAINKTNGNDCQKWAKDDGQKFGYVDVTLKGVHTIHAVVNVGTWVRRAVIEVNVAPVSNKTFYVKSKNVHLHSMFMFLHCFENML